MSADSVSAPHIAHLQGQRLADPQSRFQHQVPQRDIAEARLARATGEFASDRLNFNSSDWATTFHAQDTSRVLEWNF
jgi:hypothetical protein